MITGTSVALFLFVFTSMLLSYWLVSGILHIAKKIITSELLYYQISDYHDNVRRYIDGEELEDIL